MDMKNLPQNATLLAPAHQHGFLRVLFSSDAGYANIDILSVENWLNKHASYNPVEQLFQARKLLANQPDNIFKTQLQDPSFLIECLQFAELLKIYDIALESLPRDTAEEAALAEILNILCSLHTKADDLIQHCNQVESINENVYVMPTRYPAATDILVKRLCEKGAVFLDQQDQQPQIEFYHAINIRQEAESCAQYILRHHINAESCVIMLSDPNLLPYIKQTFKHYQIPFTILHENARDVSILITAKLLTYYLNPTNENLFAVLNSDFMKHPYLPQLIEYIQLFDADIQKAFHHIRKQDLMSELINKHDKERLDRLEACAEEARQEVVSKLNLILQANTYDTLLRAVYDQIYSILQNDQRQLEKLQKLFQNVYPQLHQPEDLLFFIHYLHTLSSSVNPDAYQGAFITDLARPLPPRSYLFVMGCTQANYPGFPSQKGFFDEAYVSKIAFPSMEERYQKHLYQTEAVMKDCQHLILSYSQGDFSGKGQEAALEIELFSQKKSVPYPLFSEFNKNLLKPNIHPATAKQLFVKNGMMHGSISSLERYISCPFSYFLKYGLNIREPLDNTFSSNRIGTLAHFVLETLVEKYGKQYANTKPEEIRQLIHTELTKAGNIYTAQQNVFEILEERLFRSLISMMDILKDMEQHTSYQPAACEYPFEYSMILGKHMTLTVKGIIDRLDVCDDLIRIIDYKSSRKNLSETKVFAAQQLQLLTYALIAQDTFQKKPGGAYYISLKTENIQADAGKMKRRPVEYVPFDKSDYEEQKIKVHRLDGWTFETDGQLMDDDGRHIKGFRMNKNEEISIRKVYDIDVLRALVKQMYAVITSRIQDGQFDLTPAQNACQFCPYHAICRYHGLTHEKEPLVEPDDTLYRKGGKGHAELES